MYMSLAHNLWMYASGPVELLVLMVFKLMISTLMYFLNGMPHTDASQGRVSVTFNTFY